MKKKVINESKQKVVKDKPVQKIPAEIVPEIQKPITTKPVPIQPISQPPPSFSIGGNLLGQQKPQAVPSFGQATGGGLFAQNFNQSSQQKPSTTINNANVAVSATFSIPLSSKVSSSSEKPAAMIPTTIPKPAEPEKSTSKNENVTTFTFKLPEKKDQQAAATVKPTMSVEGPPKTETKVEAPKPSFSFGSPNVSFGNPGEVKPVFGGTTSKASPFASIGNMVPTSTPIAKVDAVVPKPTVASEANKPTGFANLTSNVMIPASTESSATSAPSIFSMSKPSTTSSSFSFANLVPTTSVQGEKSLISFCRIYIEISIFLIFRSEAFPSF